MVRISPLSIKLKVKMRPSVLLTVLKFLFSRVRKYFWLREIVLNCAESLRMDSSRTVVCSGEDPCLAGMMARAASFSTCGRSVSITPFVYPRNVSAPFGKWCMRRTAISKSTIFSANVLISLLKQNLYSPGSLAVKTKSPCRSFVPSRMTLSVGPTTE